MKHIIELDYDQVDIVVLAELKQHRELLRKDFESRKQNDIGGIFEHDQEKDLKEIKKYLKSFDRLIKYYGGDYDCDE